MKKFLIILVSLILVLAASACAEEAVNVYVSITDDTGALVLALEPVAVTDTDQDGALTINDALILAHAAAHPDGAQAYASEATEFGQSMTLLWGVDNGGSYGYYLNNASAWSLLDPVAENDHIKAYAFTDLDTFSDTYAFFSTDFAMVPAAQGFEVILYISAYDEAWNPVTLTVGGAELLLDGQPTGIFTDEDGKAALAITEAGLYTLSARAEGLTLVAPVCAVIVAAE